jgi:hypothetical protein
LEPTAGEWDGTVAMNVALALLEGDREDETE